MFLLNLIFLIPAAIECRAGHRKGSELSTDFPPFRSLHWRAPEPKAALLVVPHQPSVPSIASSAKHSLSQAKTKQQVKAATYRLADTKWVLSAAAA